MDPLLENFSFSLDNHLLDVGVISARNIVIQPPQEELVNEIDTFTRALQEGEPAQSDTYKTAIRDMLRLAGYKPAGRGKPCNEYMANAARKGKFPHINNVVHVANFSVLLSGLPLCLLDTGKTGECIQLRYGKENEEYVFNASGQVIRLKGLVCICRQEEDGEFRPVGNPVKDSMMAKTSDTTKHVFGIVFSNNQHVPEKHLEQTMKRLKDLLETYGPSSTVEYRLFLQKNRK